MADMEGGDVRLDPIDAWLRAAMADAERRGLPRLGPLLEGLAQSTRQLRAAEWNDYVPQGGLARPEVRGRTSCKNTAGKPAG